MRAIRGRGVTVYVSDDVYAWPAHRKEILDKMNELESLIHSIETGATTSMSGTGGGADRRPQTSSPSGVTGDEKEDDR